MMRIGCVSSLDRAANTGRQGYDFIALDAGEILQPDISTNDWDMNASRFESLSRMVEIATNAVPENLVSPGSISQLVSIQNTMQRISKRAQKLGISVLECPWPRRGLSETEIGRVVESLSMAGQICAHHGVTISICAGLNFKITDQICCRVAHRCVQVSRDLSQFKYSELVDQVDAILSNHLSHVRLPDNQNYLGLVIPRLKRLKYQGRILLEQPSGSAGDVDGNDVRRLWGQ